MVSTFSMTYTRKILSCYYPPLKHFLKLRTRTGRKTYPLRKHDGPVKTFFSQRDRRVRPFIQFLAGRQPYIDSEPRNKFAQLLQTWEREGGREEGRGDVGRAKGERGEGRGMLEDIAATYATQAISSYAD